MAEKNPNTSKNRRRGAGEGCIFQRKDGRWCAVVTTGYENGKQQRKSFYGADREDVHKQLIEALAKQHQGEVIPTGKNTVGEFLDIWLEHSIKPYRRPKTVASYEAQIKLHIKPALGHIWLKKLAAARVQSFVSALVKKDLSPRSISYTRKFCEWH